MEEGSEGEGTICAGQLTKVCTGGGGGDGGRSWGERKRGKVEQGVILHCTEESLRGVGWSTA